ncbi:ead/Ea22-like family protein [Klebsiella pneumoniae]|uniref:ead/Ea22-like family protein n=1 Tax=Klebsiella pneumoniae TaxID=573 RepID=UPI001EF808E0|nr:ead/Ea22-like family protein [Klebsiella pneumoniae]MCM5752912.1 ead/Ea22-like family protein [Klebsiella pneumoniae]ULJ18627.1 ead/Ea22-like family protein [Klebsiella pneumoniae]
MTDISELALLVSKAKASVFTLEHISQFEPADIDSDDVDLRFEVDGRDTGTNVSIVDECGQAAKVIGELVEALEKAQRMESYWKAQCRGITDHCEGLQARIAELESRSVTVGNLQESAYRAGLTAGWNLGLANNNDGFNKCLTAHTAGIKVEAE